MNIADELQKLQALRDSGALTDAEFAEAKARVIGAGLDFPTAQSGPVNAATATNNFLHRITRSKSDAWVGGVCGGLAKLTGTPTWCWRMAYAVFIFTGGLGIIPYICMWIFIPEDGAQSSGG